MIFGFCQICPILATPPIVCPEFTVFRFRNVQNNCAIFLIVYPIFCIFVYYHTNLSNLIKYRYEK